MSVKTIYVSLKTKKVVNFEIQNNSASEEEIAKDENVEAGQGDQGDDGKWKIFFFHFVLKLFFKFYFSSWSTIEIGEKSPKGYGQAFASSHSRREPCLHQVELLIFWSFLI